MHVCHLVNQLAPGGAPTLILDLVRLTDTSEVTFTVCFIEGEDSLVSDFEDAGAHIVDFDAAFKFDPRALAHLARFLRSEDIDVLHTHLPYSQTLGRVFGQLGGIDCLVSTQHNVPGARHPVTRTLEQVTRPLDAATVAVSQGVERAFTGRSRPFDGRVHGQWCTIANGVDVTAFNERVGDADPKGVADQWGVDAETVYLNVSRYVPAKSQRDLVAAMDELVDTDDDVHLFVVGWGELEDDLRAAVSEHGLESHVTVTGRVPEVYDYYALADVFVSASAFEGLPLTHLEAMAAELPVVATDIRGVREVVVDGETGRLVPVGDPAALANAMRDFTSPDHQAAVARAGFEHCRSMFDVADAAEAYLRLYRTVC